jgi:hypothetical protein
MGDDKTNISLKDLGYFLAHHGVKGQKWGIRRSPKQLARASGGSGGGHQVSGDTTEVAAPSHAESVTGITPHTTIGSHKGITKFKEKPKNLTDAELQARIKRLETEKKYRDLNKKTVSTGKKHINEVLVTIGKNTATQIGTGAAVYVVKKQIEKKFQKVDIKEMFPKKK